MSEPNPAKGALGNLLRDVEWAASQVPKIDSAAGQIGPGPAWKSARARAVHDLTLGPLATKIRTALRDLVDDLALQHQQTPANLPEKETA